ncbi:uncharacterized protein E0L32_007178 [Thyridium curvatum]|uniref:Uncharacterized protein n=1 Tax=Thyridium curvatum TaxID=1093900 RepID=A0A507AWG0_9PEZI|nr:uncharacterized protein E0L32_007178 [Thyridium curvatum]TPX12063.1 hypothetical protein E0L32_007178 [Thyridium curvatum]
MATMASAARDIHATSPRDTLAGVAARSVPVTRAHPLPLPTPPNSISPALPPHGLKAQLQKAKLEAIDSDLDLHEAPGNAGAYGSPPFDSAGAITPSMLAKYHLPEILLNHGPLAIRHVMGYLTTSVPGFAGIPPAKARRLVVGALEGRGSGGEGGGLEGDVEFEKVGWGRWDARRRGQPRRATSTERLSPTSHPSGIPITQGSGWNTERARLAGRRASPGESAAFSHDDHDIMMMEHEADRMSMDGSASASCSEAPDDDVMMNDDPEDATDDEDWGAMGAAALRANSYSKSAQPGFMSRAHASGPGMRSASYAFGGMAREPLGARDFGFTPMGVASDAQERDAVEALLRLGSV